MTGPMYPTGWQPSRDPNRFLRGVATIWVWGLIVLGSIIVLGCTALCLIGVIGAHMDSGISQTP